MIASDNFISEGKIKEVMIVKLFGKKTLALLLALSMVMSVCVFAEGSFAISGATEVKVGKTVTLTATNIPTGATVTWTSSDPTIASVGSSSGVVEGKAASNSTVTITATATVPAAAEGGQETVQTATHSVTVSKTDLTVDAITVEVPKDASDSYIASLLPKSVTTSDGSLSVGGTYLGNWQKNEAGSAYTAALTTAGAAKYNYSGNITATLSVKTTWPLSSISISGVVEDDDDAVSGLTTKIRYAIEQIYGNSINSSSISFAFSNGIRGDIYENEYYVKSSYVDDLYEDGSLTDTITYEATFSGVKYTGQINLTVYSTSVSDTFTYAGGALSDIKTAINARLNAMYGRNLDTIYFDSIDLDGGLLYTDSTCDYEIDDDSFSSSALAALYYLPDGSGETSVIEYYAYTSNDSDDPLAGYIYLISDEFLLLTGEIGSDEVLDFNADDLLNAVYDWDDDFEVKNIKFTTVPNSASSGYLYYEYDADESSNTKVTTSKTYYVEPTGSQLELTNFTYVPGSSTSGVVEIIFKAYKSSSSSITGIIRVNVIEKADITIEAGKGETVLIDPDWFLDYADEKDTSNKDLELVSVTISGAPRSANAGYLYTDGAELTKSGDKTFYADEDDVDVDKKKYDLFDLYFVGGKKATTTSATFTVTYVREGSTSKKTVTGTIDFVVGTSRTLNGSLRAAEVMPFSDTTTLNAFEDLGGNDNVYVEFTSLPVGGKLYYNYGTSAQEDVTIGTDYYIRTASGKKQLKNITFVPSYSSSKIAKTISMNIKAYNSKDKAVTGTINIAVTYAASSAYFYDVNTSTYADSVDFLKNRGITTGMTTTSFGLTSNVTRGQFVTFLWRAAGSPVVYGTNTFKDVKVGEYYYNAVLWAVQNKITTGRSTTVFDPNANVTHQELLTFLYRYDVEYLRHSGTTGSASAIYDFNKVDAYAQTPVKWAIYKGIIDYGNLNPTVAGTRGTVALWLHRMLTL